MNERNTPNKKILIETFGCPRNQVDTEIFYKISADKGFVLTDDYKEADIILLNTCGFINSAKEESTTEIIEYGDLKNDNAILIVTGCLVKRYENTLRKLIPEVDYFISLKDYQGFLKLLNKIYPELNKTQKLTGERKLLDQSSYAYLKIADGCENYCSYCAIPSIRGKVVSEPVGKLVEEAHFLAEQGVKELIVTAMDINQYGKDKPPSVNIITLLNKLAAVDPISWIRLLYLHPKNISYELIEFIRDNEKICPYLDIPLQHINNKILKSMNRGITRYEIERLIDMIRREIPHIALRTTFIVGYPGETDKEFEELMHFVDKTEFNRVGVFIFSKEESTPACNMPNQVHHKTAVRRQRELMALQENISENLLSKYIGTTMPVIVDNLEQDPQDPYLECRTVYDAPEIDGIVIIPCSLPIPKGSIIDVEITSNFEHDLMGRIAAPQLVKKSGRQ